MNADASSPKDTTGPVHSASSQECCSSEWELAYARFETSEEEIAKFIRRLRAVGAERWPRDWRLLELCSGRGNGLKALEKLGFQSIEGLDLSNSLISQYHGSAKCYVADCRKLPFDDASRDLILVQGGLHHLPRIPADLEQTLEEIHRVLKPAGRFFLVEPWLTPFLRAVHFVCRIRIARKLVGKIDALATMIDNEYETYQQWLAQPSIILSLLDQRFAAELHQTKLGKLVYLGRKRD